MMIIGCDFHPSWQQVSWLDTETGETGERKLVQASGDAERFYRQVAAPALIGMEATGNCHWLVERLHRRVIQVRFPESWSSTFSGEKAVLTHLQRSFCSRSRAVHSDSISTIAISRNR